MEGISHSYISNGVSSGLFEQVCFCFIDLRTKTICGHLLSDIEQVTIGPPKMSLPDKMLKSVPFFLDVLRNSVFRDLIDKYVTETDEGIPVIRFNPNEVNITSIIMVVQLVRLIWEFPPVIRRVGNWIDHGCSKDEALLLGHYVDTDGSYDSLQNTNHLLYKNSMPLEGLLKDMENLVYKLLRGTETIQDVSVKEVYFPYSLFKEDRPERNMCSKDLYAYMTRHQSNLNHAYKISKRSIQEIRNAIKN